MKQPKNKHFIFILLVITTAIVYPLVMINLPIYKVFSCNKDTNVCGGSGYNCNRGIAACEYTEHSIYQHKTKHFSFDIDLNFNPILIVHEYTGRRGISHYYQLSLYHDDGKEYKLFSHDDQKQYVNELKDKIIQQLNNQENKYVQVTEGDPNPDFWIYFCILILVEGAFYYPSYLIINMRKK